MTMHDRPFLVEFLGTPEAGKTTTIGILRNLLVSLGYKTTIIQESAEIVPTYFKKGSIDAHVWMRLTTSRGILESLYKDNNIVLIDRGTIDTLFWDYLLYDDYNLRQHANDFFVDMGIFPDLCITLHIPAELSILRRGGEGRLVTKKFVEEYNNKLFDFEKTITQPTISIDTSSNTPDEVAQILLEKIQMLMNSI